MPLPAKLRRERRRYNQELERKQNPVPKRRCDNCFIPYPQTTKNRRFCSGVCRNEFFKHGSAFGPLKNRLQHLVAKMVKAAVQRIERLEIAVEYLAINDNANALQTLSRGREILKQEEKKLKAELRRR